MYGYARREDETFSGFGAEITATDASGRTCRVSERRIHPAVEPAHSLLVRVATAFLANPAAKISLHHAAYRAYLKLKQAAEGDGIAPNLLTIISGHRDVATQRSLWARALERYGSPERARIFVAPPGGSPHHTGRAIDFFLGARNDSRNIPALRRTAAYHWLVCNASRFGFTPYGAEPWHWEFNPSGLDPAAPPSPDVHFSGFAEPPGPQPPPNPLASFSSSEHTALRLTTLFEGGRPLQFDALTGNFDNMGISFGLLQWNFGQNSLQPLLREFMRNFPARFTAVFGAEAPRLRAVLAQPLAQPMQFARSINDASNNIMQPWAAHFQALGAEPDFQAIEIRVTRKRMDRALEYVRRFNLCSERSLALMFDIVTQAGDSWRCVKRRERLINADITAQQQRAARVLTENEVLRLIAEVVIRTSRPQFQADVRARKMAIINGQGLVHRSQVNVDGTFGISDQRHDGKMVAGCPR